MLFMSKFGPIQANIASALAYPQLSALSMLGTSTGSVTALLLRSACAEIRLVDWSISPSEASSMSEASFTSVAEDTPRFWF